MNLQNVGGEYLLGLREHSKRQGLRQRNTLEIQPGDIVVLRDDLTPRVWWKLARVLEILKGRDGRSQAAWIQVFCNDKKVSILRRPIQHLIPLEIGSPNNGNRI